MEENIEYMKPRTLIEIREGVIVGMSANQDCDINILDYDTLWAGGHMDDLPYSPDSIITNEEIDNYIKLQKEEYENT